MRLIIFLSLLLSFADLSAQVQFTGKVTDNKNVVQTLVYIVEADEEVQTQVDGTFNYQFENTGIYHFNIENSSGFIQTFELNLTKPEEQFEFVLSTEESEVDLLNEIVISGTMKPVLRSESLVPVEVYTPTFFKRNPSPNIFEALQNVNGVKPQVNCSVCNTGDIHINGLEGPYTFVLIDGMPIVSGLSTVYGLSGIPNSLIEKVEIVKGPASSLYGSEAVGGLINIITKNPLYASKYAVDVFGTS